MMESLVERFERVGYVVVDRVIGPSDVRALRSLFLPMFARKSAGVLQDTVLHYPQILDVLRTPRLVRALAMLLGEPFVVPPYSSVAYNGYGLFHTDTTGAELSGQRFHQDKDFRIVTVAIYLQDNDEHGGGIRLAPGSHTEPDRYVGLMRWKAARRRLVEQSRLRRIMKRLSRDRFYDWTRPFEEHERAVDVPSKAGDAVIWDLRMAHRAGPRRTRAPAPEDGKLALFFNCGANNPTTTQAYMS